MPIKIYISAAPTDRVAIDDMLLHLQPLCRYYGLDPFHDGLLAAGQALSEAGEHLNAASIILLCLSPAYLASETHTRQAQAALQRRSSDLVHVLPLILAPCLWECEFGFLQPLPRSGTPISLWAQRDAAWLHVAKELEALLLAPGVRAVPRPPSPVADAPYEPAFYVSRPVEERIALNRLRDSRAAVVLQGPWLYGKATLLRHLLAQTNGSVVHISLPRLCAEHADALSSIGELVRNMAAALLAALRPADAAELLERTFRRSTSDNRKLSWLLREHLLPDHERLLLCIEQADKVHGQPFQHDFFGLLRGLGENDGEVWSRLRLIVTVSAEPNWLESTDHSSFFVSANPIRLPPFDRAQAGQLAPSYGYAPTDPQIDSLHQLTGGHPGLLRTFFHEAAMREVPLSALSVRDGVFRQHLRRLRAYLEQHGLLPALTQVLSHGGRARIDDETYCLLYSQGILIEEDVHEYRVRCPLYEDYFRKLCSLS